MRLTQIQVQCTAGWKADETPRRAFLLDGWVDVVSVEDRWYQGGLEGGPVYDYFKILGSDRRTHLLRHDRELDAWFLVEP